MNALHNHLRLHSGTTPAAMWQDLARLRRLGCDYGDLPQTEADFHAGLESLVAAGLAERSGRLVLWLPVRKPAERTLFV